MNIRILSSGLAAVALAGTAALGTAGVAVAQSENDDSRCPRSGTGPAAGQSGYAPRGQGAGVSNQNARRGERQNANSGCSEFAPGTQVSGEAHSAPLNLGTTRASSGGSASFSFTIPSSFENGRHTVTMTGQAFDGSGTRTVTLPFTVVGGVAAGTQGRTLPRTGAGSVVELTAAGVVLVGVGAGMVVVARRRRSDSPVGTA